MKTTATLRLLASGLLLCALCASAPLRAADGNPPERMSYQGYLTDTSGNPLGNTNTGPKNYDVIFRIFNDQTLGGAGNRVWTELQTVTVDRGYFSVVLGEGGSYSSEARPPLSSVFTNTVDASDRFIEMTVRGIGPGGADATLSPRLRLLPSPYAMLAATAVNARNLVNAANGQVISVSGTSVGINKPAPAATLDVNGSVAASSLTVSGTAALNGTVNAATLNVSGPATVNNTLTANTFVGNGTIPLGGIIMWSGATPPAGWALCDGGTYYGRTTPDLRGRFVLASGAGAGLTARSVGQTGGEENHVLAWNEMPGHSHTVSDPGHSHTVSDPGHNHTVNDPGHSHGIMHDTSHGGWSTGGFYSSDRNYGTTPTYSATTGISVNNRTTGIGVNSQTTGITLGYTGGNGAHNTMPPFYVLAFIMRVQ